jgi:hypothetical protein
MPGEGAVVELFVVGRSQCRFDEVAEHESRVGASYEGQAMP